MKTTKNSTVVWKFRPTKPVRAMVEAASKKTGIAPEALIIECVRQGLSKKGA